MSITVIDLLRHGEPVGGRRYRGRIDDPLSERGWAQMRAATLDRSGWSAIISSPLLRCSDFARELAGATSLPLAFDERLMEVGFGEWEGKTQDELMAIDPDAVFDFKRDPVGYRPKGAEPLDVFYSRVALAYDDIVSAHPGGHVLIVAHAGVIRMTLCRVLGLAPEMAYRIQVGSAAMARIKVERKGELHLDALMHLTPGG
jgi:alpha-ribazole phosphatase/probable phosphoglycerate mutase